MAILRAVTFYTPQIGDLVLSPLEIVCKDAFTSAVFNSRGVTDTTNMVLSKKARALLVK